MLEIKGLRATVDGWNAACQRGMDDAFGRPPGSMMPILRPPFSAGLIWANERPPPPSGTNTGS